MGDIGTHGYDIDNAWRASPPWIMQFFCTEKRARNLKEKKRKKETNMDSKNKSIEIIKVEKNLRRNMKVTKTRKRNL